MARQCKATTKAGKRCKVPAQKDREVCLAHDQERRGSKGFGGPQPGSGRPKMPRVIDRLREMAEEDVDRFVRPILEGLVAEKAHVVGDGQHARLEFTSDIPTRLKAAAMALDRIYGKPAQALDVKHSAEESEVDRQIRELLSQLSPNGNGVRARS